MISREPVPMSDETRKRFYRLSLPSQIVVRSERIAEMPSYSERARRTAANTAAEYREGMSEHSRAELLGFRAWEASQPIPGVKKP